MWSVALDTLFTTLRLLAPATLLTLFWGHQSFLVKLFHQVERAVKSVIFSSNTQNEAALTWLLDYISPVMPHPSMTLDPSVTSLQQVWEKGLLCRALERAVPGTCGTHERDHGMAHAQIVAQQYLGIEPVFMAKDLQTMKVLSKRDEIKFAHYIMSVRTAIQRLSPSHSKPGSPWTSQDIRTYTLDYVARGMGLIQTRNNKKAIFRIYPTAQQGFDPGDISILIRGPGDSHGSVTVPAVYTRTHFLRNVFLGVEQKTKFLEITLPLTQGTAYMRPHGKTDISKAFYIPKIKQDIDISVSIDNNHVKVTYVTKMEGRYEISLISKGCNIVGSPFTVESLKTSTEELAIFECDENDDTESVDSNSDRKVVFRIVDFVTEKMLLHDNGTLEKISDFEAKQLLSKAKLIEESAAKADANENSPNSAQPDLIGIENITKMKHQRSHFKDISKKILFLVKICKRFQDLVRRIAVESLNDFNSVPQKKTLLDTPDIVNSTRSGSNSIGNCSTQNSMEESLDIYDCPLSLSTNTESISCANSDINGNPFYSDYPSDLDACLSPKIIVTAVEGNKNATDFANSTLKSTSLLKDPKTPILKMLNEPNATLNTSSSAEDAALMFDFETPILPITESINPVIFKEMYDESSNFNDFIDAEEPLTPVADFLIGAPVSLPPLLKAPSPEPTLNTTLKRNQDGDISKCNPQNYLDYETMNSDPHSSSAHATPLLKSDDLSEDNSLKWYQQSSESEHISRDVMFTFTDKEEILDKVKSLDLDVHEKNGEYEQSISPFELFVDNQTRDHFLRSEVWDSAYVSIDENNSSPDTMSNKSDITMPTSTNFKIKTILDVDTKRSAFLMGPAERVIWPASRQRIIEGDYFVSTNPFISRPTVSNVQGRNTFTPIDEESDNYIDKWNNVFDISNESRNDDKIQNHEIISRDENPTHETESVSAAFSELSDVFNQYFSDGSETHSLTYIVGKEYCKNTDILSSTECLGNNGEGTTAVNSASDKVTDVKRRNCETDATREMELISEVQTIAAESHSASREHNIIKENNNNMMASEIALVEKNESNVQMETEPEKTYVSISGENSNKNLVEQKRKYWDEKIKFIKESTEMVPFIKKKLSTKCLRKNDSLGKKRGRNIVTASNFKVRQSQSKNMDNAYMVSSKTDLNSVSEKASAEINLVKKWKHFWDEKVESITTDCAKNTTNSSCETVREKQSDKEKTLIGSNHHNLSTITVHEKAVIAVGSDNILENALTVENSTINKNDKILDSVIPETDKKIPDIVNQCPNISTIFLKEKVPVPASSMPLLPVPDAVPKSANESQLYRNEFQDKPQTTFNPNQTTPIQRTFHNKECASYRRANFVITSNKTLKDDDDEDLKAFETSPKRFFGKSTSMKNIKQRIDQFLSSSDCSATKMDVKPDVTATAVRSLVADRLMTFGDRCKSLESICKNTTEDNTKSTTIIQDSGPSNISDGTENGYNYKYKICNKTTEDKQKSTKIVQGSGTNKISDSTENSSNYKSKSMLNLWMNKSVHEKPHASDIDTDEASFNVFDIMNAEMERSTDDSLEVNDQYSGVINPRGTYIKQVMSMFDRGESDKCEHANLQQRKREMLENERNIHHASVCAAEMKTSYLKPDSRKYKDETELENKTNHSARNKIEVPYEVKQSEVTTFGASDSSVGSGLKCTDAEGVGSTAISSPESDSEYKERFKKAQSFFQSLDNLDMKTYSSQGQLNECEELLYTLGAGNMKIPKKFAGKGGTGKFRSKSLRKLRTQAHSAPTSDTEFDTMSLSDQWEESNIGAGGRKLIKISERFQVEDLFRDVTGDGSLKRKGSFRGIPNTQAVLAAFRSMENIAGMKMSSYEISASDLDGFSKRNSGVAAQSHHNDYPYLPTTKPSKFRSRKDAKTYGLISRKELLRRAFRPRRNSVPDGWVLNEKFTVEL